MRTVKSKGERLNWPLLSDMQKVNSKEILLNLRGRVLSESELSKRKGHSFQNHKLLVP